MLADSKINFVDLTGKWEFIGQPIYPDGKTGSGIIAITFKQNGTEIVGDLASVVEPYTNKPPEDPERTNAKVAGQVVFTAQPNANLVRFTRVNNKSAFTAIFIGAISEDGQTIHGYFVNNERVHGAFTMTRST